MADARVTVGVEVQGIADAISQVGKVGADWYERAQASAKPIAGRGAPNTAAAALAEAGAAGPTAYSPDRIDRILTHLSRWKLGEQEINKLIAQRKLDLEAINKITVPPGKEMYYNAMLRGGATPAQAATNPLVGGAASGDPKVIERYQRQIQRMEGYREDLKEGLYSAQDRAFDKWMPRLVQGFARAASLLGIASAGAIAYESRNRAKEFGIAAADIRAFLGRGSENLNEIAMQAAGPYGVYQIDAARIAGSLRAAGMTGTTAQQIGMTQRFAGLGMHFGLGRQGMAQAAEQGVGGGGFYDAGHFERFANMAGGVSAATGLNAAQRRYQFEDWKGQYEMLSKLYGGRPLNEQSYFGGIYALMGSMRGLNLPAGGAPIATQVMGGLMESMSPIGKSFGDVMRQGALLGLDISKGYMPTLIGINKMMTNAGGVTEALQRLGGNVGIRPGERPTDEQLNNFFQHISGQFPQMLKPLGQYGAVGGDVAGLWQLNAKDLPKDVSTGLQAQIDEARRQADYGPRTVDIGFAGKEITGIGDKLVKIESEIKEMLGPTLMAILSSLMGLSSHAIAFFLGKGGVGATLGALGGVAAKAGTAVAGSAALPVLGAIGAGATLYGAYRWSSQHGADTRQRVMEAGFAAANRYGLDPLRFVAMAGVESEYGTNPRDSSKGAMGPWQIMPKNAQAFKMKDPRNIEENADVAAQLFKEHLGMAKGDVRRATSIYSGNAGKETPHLDWYMTEVTRRMGELAVVVANNTAATRDDADATRLAGQRPANAAPGGPTMNKQKPLRPDH